jgi:hypothetical protein
MNAPSEGTHRRSVRFGTGRAWSAHQLLTAGITMMGSLAFTVALERASGGFDPLFWAAVPLSVFLLPVSGSGWPLAYWGVMVLTWFYLTPEGSFSAWSVLAAAGLLLGHAAAAHSASAPAGTSFPARTVRRWVRQALVALGAAGAVGLAATLLAGRVDEAGAVAQALGLFGLALGVWLLRSNEPDSSS